MFASCRLFACLEGRRASVWGPVQRVTVGVSWPAVETEA